jgi:hypothetical protein
MTQSLSKVFKKASSLSPEIQEQIAAFWNDDLNAELQWDSTLKDSAVQLESLAQKALDDYNNGMTVIKGFDEL